MAYGISPKAESAFTRSMERLGCPVTIRVVAGIIRRDGRILITRRLANVHLPGLWEFPGGKVEAGESLEDALAREILEELGIVISIDDEFLRLDHHYPEKSVRLHFFNCSVVAGEPRSIAVADFRWVPPAELDQFPFPEADRELIRRLQAAAG